MSLTVRLVSKKPVKTVCYNCGNTYKEYEDYYSANITHNLGIMAEKAGIYKHLWCPEELGIKTARRLIVPLTEGLKKLKESPNWYKKYDSPNGWGLYIHFVPFVEKYLKACICYPRAKIEISR